MKNLKLKKKNPKLKEKTENSSKKLRVRESLASFLCPSDVKKMPAHRATIYYGQAYPFFSDLGRWKDAFEAGLLAVMKYGGAEEGDRTMVDALLPAVKVHS